MQSSTTAIMQLNSTALIKKVDTEDFEVLEDEDINTSDNAESTSEYKVISIEIETELSAEELKVKGQELADIGIQIKRKLEDLETVKSTASTIRKAIDTLQQDLIEVSYEYDYGKKRTVHSCYRRENYETAVYEYVDVVTGEILKTEPFYEEDIFKQVGDL